MDCRKLLTGSSFLGAACLAAVTAASAGGLAILEPVVSDNGDGDGFADTRETVTVRLRLQNTSGEPLSGVAVHLTSEDYDKVCITVPTIEVGNLQPGEIRETGEGFQFVVADVDRDSLGLGAHDDLSIRFDLSVSALPATNIYPWRLRMDLDLNVGGGSGTQTFLESFEEGLGAFEVENIDSGLHGLANSDGYRCQYFDPDWVNSNTYGDPLFESECYIAQSDLHADAIWWGLSGPETSPGGGRGFTGFHSLFYGIDMGEPLRFTTPMGTMEAVVSTEPIYLGWDQAHPTLSIMHQVALIDGRVDVTQDDEPQETGLPPFPEPGAMEVFDRGVVMAQVADEQGQPAGDWIKLDPFVNVYDQIATTSFANCMFDPVDDGSDEDDFFDAADPARRYGPSTTCFPEYSWSNIGETDVPFDPANIGLADGPGHQGMWGIGTWINSKFDLSRFRGRGVRLRFLVSAMQIVPNHDWEEYLLWNPNPGDNGWWIDDVTVTDALAVPASVSTDLFDNSGLPDAPASADLDSDAICAASDNCPGVSNPDQADGDFDDAGTACDCNDADSTVYPGAQEINDGIDNQCPGDSGYGFVDDISGTAGFFDADDKNVFSWPEQEGASRYDVARARSTDFTDHCTLFANLFVPRLLDTAPVYPGMVHYYLVRPSLPNQGSWGGNSAGAERAIPCGP